LNHYPKKNELKCNYHYYYHTSCS